MHKEKHIDCLSLFQHFTDFAFYFSGYFRIVLQEHTVAPTGRHVAVLGSYDPHQKKSVLKADKIKQWVSKGAQVSDSAYNLFVKEGVLEGKRRVVKMEKPKKEEVATEAAPAA